MTNEQAIELLKRISDSQFDGEYGDERREALSMAVRALFSQQTVNDSQGLVNDCISRKMAIDAFEPEHDTDWYTPRIIEVLEALPPVQPQACDDAISRDDAIMAVKTGALSAATIFGRTDEGATAYYETVKAIKALPSAQPQWIPCSERNPDRDGKYLVTSARYKHVSVKIFTLKYWWEEGMPLAWMPLPKPYGGEQNEAN